MAFLKIQRLFQISTSHHHSVCTAEMSANPVLVPGPTGVFPAPFPGEVFVLRRPGVSFELEGVRTASHKWNARGTAFISNVRMVFVADKPDPSGLASFDVPLVYTRNDKLNQPIFGCNNISGQVWPAVQGGGPSGSLPPHHWTLYFKEGGMGTFYPMYYTLAERAKRAFEAEQQRQQQSTYQQYQQPPQQQAQYPPQPQQQVYQQQVQPQQFPTQYQQQMPFPQQPFMQGQTQQPYPQSQQQPQSAPGQLQQQPGAQRLPTDDESGPTAPAVPPEYAQALAAKAFVDPADPSIIYLSSPTTEEQRLPEAPKYAANYGQDEKYVPM